MIDPRIPLMGQQQQDTLGNLAQGIQMGQGLRQLISGRQLGKMQQLAPEDRQAFADKSMFSRELNAGIKANNAAQEKAMYDRLKTEAEISKIGSEAYKNNTQGQGYGLDNGGKKLGAIQGAFQQASLTGDKAQVLLGMDALVRTGMMSPEDYQFQAAIVSTMSPDELKQYAGGINFAKAKDPAALQYQSADNVANNQTAQRGQDITSQTTMRGQDIGANTADKNRVQQGQQFAATQAYNEQKDRIASSEGKVVNAADGKSYIFYPGLNKYEPMLDPSGQHVSKASADGSKMTEQQSRDALFGARMQESGKIISSLEKDGVSPSYMSKLPFIGEGLVNAVPSVLGGSSVKQQQYTQAKRDFINALLRKESGAVIGDNEFASADKQYFTQIGDSKEVVDQKAKNRQLAQTMIANASGAEGKKQIEKAVSGGNQLEQLPSYKGSSMSLSDVKQSAKQAGVSTEEMISVLKSQGVVIQ